MNPEYSGANDALTGLKNCVGMTEMIGSKLNSDAKSKDYFQMSDALYVTHIDQWQTLLPEFEVQFELF